MYKFTNFKGVDTDERFRFTGAMCVKLKPIPVDRPWRDATGGFADEVFDRSLDVCFPPELLAKLPENRQNAVVEILAMDPRPAVQDDPERIYGMRFAGYEIKFTVDGRCLRVVGVDKEI